MPSTTSPSVGLALLDPETQSTLQDVFFLCGVQPIVMGGDVRDRLTNEKFQGCALPLDHDSADLIETIRRSPLNHRIVIYGIANDERPAPALLKLGINVVFKRPIMKREAVTRVHSTTALLIHEMRRYIRIPLAVPVQLRCGELSATVLSREVSGGGMSLETGSQRVPTGAVQLSFALPNSVEVSVGGTACWHLNRLTGFSFDENDAARIVIKQWVDSWLGVR